MATKREVPRGRYVFYALRADGALLGWFSRIERDRAADAAAGSDEALTPVTRSQMPPTERHAGQVGWWVTIAGKRHWLRKPSQSEAQRRWREARRELGKRSITYRPADDAAGVIDAWCAERPDLPTGRVLDALVLYAHRMHVWVADQGEAAASAPRASGSDTDGGGDGNAF